MARRLYAYRINVGAFFYEYGNILFFRNREFIIRCKRMLNVFIATHTSIIVPRNLFKSKHLLKKTADTLIHMQLQMILLNKSDLLTLLNEIYLWNMRHPCSDVANSHLKNIIVFRNWKAGELRREFFNWDKQVTEIAKPYWEKIFY